MLKRRLIPVLFLQDGWMVRSELFRIHQIIGSPTVHVERMVQWDVDELIVIDISRNPGTIYEHIRADYRHRPATDMLSFVQMIAGECRIPLTFGGGIHSLEDARERIQNGADKVSINRLLYEKPEVLSEIAHLFGSQAVVASIDYRMVDGVARAYYAHAERDGGVTALEAARRAERQGAGEVLLNAIDRDGTAQGYDIETISVIADAVQIPVIACGGAGHMRHFLNCYEMTAASAVAAGNIFHFTENAYPRAKQFLRSKGLDVR